VVLGINLKRNIPPTYGKELSWTANKIYIYDIFKGSLEKGKSNQRMKSQARQIMYTHLKYIVYNKIQQDMGLKMIFGYDTRRYFTLKILGHVLN
jgi:hypothetical protein